MAAAGGFGSLGGFPLLILMFVAMYFLLIAPNQRKQKQWQQMLSNLKPGDKVTTNGGIRGTIISVKDDALVVKCRPGQREAGDGEERDCRGDDGRSAEVVSGTVEAKALTQIAQRNAKGRHGTYGERD